MLNTSMLVKPALAAVKAMFVPFMRSADFVANVTGLIAAVAGVPSLL